MSKSNVHIPLYGANESGGGLGDLVKILFADYPDDTNLRIVKETFNVTGGVTTELSVAISESVTVYGGYLEIQNSGGAGNIDCDLGLTSGAGGFGTAYGDQGDGVYAFKATEFVNVGSEKFFLSFDGNSQSSSEVSQITVCALVGKCQAGAAG